jgi:F-type H+-transporting ATPase subunit b
MNFLAFAESIQLVPDGTLFLHIAIIILMVFVLNRILFRPVIGLLEEREKHTHGRTGEAHEILGRVEAETARHEQTLREARAEGYRLLEQTQKEAGALRQQRIGAVRAEVEQMLAEQKQAIRAQSEEAKAGLAAEARRMAETVSAQILGRPV